MAVASSAMLCGLSFEPFCNFAPSFLYICSFIYMSSLFWLEHFRRKKNLLTANSVINHRSGTAIFLYIFKFIVRPTALYIILRSLSLSHLVLEVHACASPFLFYIPLTV